jgi:hypothetical protein
MATAASWLLGTVLMFVEFGVLACSALQSTRRSRFYLRLTSTHLVMAVLAVALAFAIRSSALPQHVLGLAWILLLLTALAAAPTFCYQAFARFEGPSDGDDDGGSGPGRGPQPEPRPPRGDTPLPDAEQARTRRRDHSRPRLRGTMQRRRTVEPARTRPPVGPGRT